MFNRNGRLLGRWDASDSCNSESSVVVRQVGRWTSGPDVATSIPGRSQFTQCPLASRSYQCASVHQTLEIDSDQGRRHMQKVTAAC